LNRLIAVCFFGDAVVMAFESNLPCCPRGNGDLASKSKVVWRVSGDYIGLWRMSTGLAVAALLRTGVGVLGVSTSRSGLTGFRAVEFVTVVSMILRGGKISSSSISFDRSKPESGRIVSPPKLSPSRGDTDLLFDRYPYSVVQGFIGRLCVAFK
jgi:hypothetical protein